VSHSHIFAYDDRFLRGWKRLAFQGMGVLHYGLFILVSCTVVYNVDTLSYILFDTFFCFLALVCFCFRPFLFFYISIFWYDLFKMRNIPACLVLVYTSPTDRHKCRDKVGIKKLSIFLHTIGPLCKTAASSSESPVLKSQRRVPI
jgi:hypothetical protein